MISFSLAPKKNRFQKAKEEKEAKKRQDEQEAAQVYETFVQSFSAKDSDDYAKTFIKAGVGGDEEKAYRMDSGFLDSSKTVRSSSPPSSSSRPAATKKREREMDKFLEEIRERQLALAQQPQPPPAAPEKGSYDDGGHTTNIYI
eukprot:gene28329-34204_t